MDQDKFYKSGRAASETAHFEGYARAGRVARRVRRAMCRIKKSAQGMNKGWLHDNFYMAQREAHAFYRFADTPARFRLSGGTVYIFALCQTYLNAADAAVNVEDLKSFFRGVLSSKGLEEKESRAIRPFLGAAILLRLLSAKDEDLEGLFTALRLLSEESLICIGEEFSSIGETFRRDAVYPEMNEESRSAYREAAAGYAVKHGISEKEAAEELMHKAVSEGKHIGEVLFPAYGKDDRRPLIYGLTLYLFTSLISFLIWRTGERLLAFLSWVVIYELIKIIVDRVLLRLSRRPPLFSMEFENGIPENEAVLVCITTVVSDENELQKLLERLEEHYLAERGGKHLCFALLLDLPEADSPQSALLDELGRKMENGLEKLEKSYGQAFGGFLRKAVYSDTQRKFIGRERKRGALTDLIAYLERGDRRDFAVCHFPSSERIRHLITLDRDTVPYPGSIALLAAAAAHPMNRPVIRGGRVKEGFGILEPSVVLNPESLASSRFARLMGGIGGNDVYQPMLKAFSQSFFGRTPFGGKGLIDVHTAEALLDDAFRPETVLSHDTPEGGLLRAGRVAEALFFEDFPSSPAAYYKRLDRWTRGDAQNTPLIFQTDGYTGYLLMDNLRRAVLPLSALISFILPFYIGKPLFALLPLALITEPVFSSLTSLARFGGEYAPRYLTVEGNGIRRSSEAVLVRWMLLPYEAFVSVRALLKGLYRRFISGRDLLAWSTTGISSDFRSWCGALLPPSLLASLFFPPMGPLWIGAAFLLPRLSGKPQGPSFTEEEREYIREALAESMGFFREVCRAEWGYLPADSLQVYPAEGISPRTSPTDIGMFLLAAVSYHDLMLDGAEEILIMAQKALESLDKLPKVFGHLYNWYDLRERRPIPPRILSSVDSGNLRASLYVFSAAMRERGETDSAALAMRLADEMRFDFFYKKEKKLLAVAYDTDKKQLTDNAYDLYESEARIASYLAIAHGEVPLTHWKKCGRSVKSWQGYAGAASWGGTLFEYLTPLLFMKAPEGTLARESEAFAVMAEKLEGKRNKLPWGISESAFYAFDDTFHYRYKAHGVHELATAPSRDGEYVIAPYAAFLSLESEGSVENLRRIDALGGRGQYGFYEALDASDPHAIRPVECYMPHHVGMQAAAAANALCDGVHRKRFLMLPAHRAYERLLWESARHTPLADLALGEAPPASLGNAEGARLLTGDEKGGEEERTIIPAGKIKLTCGSEGILAPDSTRLSVILEHRGLRTSLLPPEANRRHEAILAKDRALYASRTADFDAELRITGGSTPQFSLYLTNRSNASEHYTVRAERGGEEWFASSFTLERDKSEKIIRSIEG